MAGFTAAIGLSVVSGCAVTTAAPSTTLAPLPFATATTTAPVAPVARTSGIEGFAAAVRDGRTFDLQVGPTTQQVTLAHITVADVTTCEGSEAKRLLEAIIVGHKIRLDTDGTVWRDDLDVARAMIDYGMAKAADKRYASADDHSVDARCATTTMRAPPVVIAPPTTAPRRRPTKPTSPPTTQPVLVHTTLVTATG